MNNEFKIKIITNSNGEPVDLTNMSLDAADSLNVFITSLTELAKTYNDYEGNNNITLSLSEGSVVASLVFPEKDIDVINDIKEITNNKSSNNDRIKCLKVRRN